MAIEKKLDYILNAKSKVKIIRLFISRRNDFMAPGNDIARSIGLTPPATHTALKELHDQGILKLNVVGKQHIYGLNASSRVVRDILRPAFQKELSVKEDIKDFLVGRLKKYKINNTVISVMLYGSIVKGDSREGSDCDIAVIVKDAFSKRHVEDIFIDKISSEFSAYFGVSLDAYIKTYAEFLNRLKKKLSPVSTLMKSYSVIYGKDLTDYK